MSSRRYRSSSSLEDSNDRTKAESNKCTNIFRNDGSFLEMFKQMQKASQQTDNTVSKPLENVPGVIKESTVVEKEPQQSANSKPTSLFIGRRRSTKALPVGKVKKLKTEDNEGKPSTTDAWAKYLEEVKKYKETYCDADQKNRSLVK